MFVHFRLSEIEKNETEQERAQESAEDIATETLMFSVRKSHILKARNLIPNQKS